MTEPYQGRPVNQRWVSTLISAATHWISAFSLGPMSALINIRVA